MGGILLYNASILILFVNEVIKQNDNLWLLYITYIYIFASR